mmetsp:Transcript_100467/g.199492  ORF Transcript_100467/g.199492 Transcript_100467/m.199492 type:complete len:248 (-) Transcript_100467:312-1055(-)
MKIATCEHRIFNTFTSWWSKLAGTSPSYLFINWITATTSLPWTTGAQSMDLGKKLPTSSASPPQRSSVTTSAMLATSLCFATHAATDASSCNGTRRVLLNPWATELQSSCLSASTIQSVARSQESATWPSAMMVFIMLSSSLAFFARSAAPRSTTNKLSIPMKHPMITPQTPPSVDTRLVMPSRICASVNPGNGRPSLRHRASMVPPKVTPHASLTTCPIAAAASVGRPRQTPTVLSMASPAQISTL